MKSILVFILFLFFILNVCSSQTLPLFIRNDIYQEQWVRDFILDDFNNDNILDMAVLISEVGILISFGNGDGTFTEHNTIEFEPINLDYYILSDDFNLDGNNDLFVPNTLFLGKGNGVFEKLDIEGMTGKNHVSGDFNNDNIPDITTRGINQPPTGKLDVFLGIGDGSFQEPIPFSIPDKTVLTPVFIGDFNNDGNADLLITFQCYIDEYGGTCKYAKPGVATFYIKAAVLYGNGDGSFSEDFTIISESAGTGKVFAGDFNLDGNLDILYKGYRFEMHLGDGSGNFYNIWSYEREVNVSDRWDSFNFPFIMDSDQDGLLDIVCLGQDTSVYNYSNTISFMKGNGDGTFRGENFDDISGVNVLKVLVYDLNQDKRDDFIAVSFLEYGNSISIFINDGITEVEEKKEKNPLQFKLLQNTPNPVNNSTVIPYSISEPSNVKLEIYSISGQKVTTLVDSYMSAGTHTAKFDGSRLASGMYFYKFRSKGLNTTGKMLMVK